MSSCPTKTVESGLIKKGFKITRKTKHIMYVYHTIAGKKTIIITKISMSPEKELSSSLVSLMARQLNLKTSDFEDLCHCPLSQENYETILAEKGVI